MTSKEFRKKYGKNAGRFYIDYDEDPAVGAYQGVFWLDRWSGHAYHNASDLVGAEIIGVETDKDGRMIFIVCPFC